MRYYVYPTMDHSSDQPKAPNVPYVPTPYVVRPPPIGGSAPLDLTTMREFALSEHRDDIINFFGIIPPNFSTQSEIADYLGEQPTNSSSLVYRGRCLCYDADPEKTWYVYPFLYAAVGENYDDFRAIPMAPINIVRNAPLMHLSSWFCRRMSVTHKIPAPPRAQTVDVLVSWHTGTLTATLGVSVQPKVIEAAGFQWRVGHGKGEFPITLPPAVVAQITPPIIPRWVERDFTDPDYYTDESYAFVQRCHAPMAREIVAALGPEYYPIVPGDGSGLFASLVKGPGVFGDTVVTKNSDKKVVRETAEQTIARADPGRLKPVLILSYVARFLKCFTLGYPLVVIDTPQVMDIIPGLKRVTEALYTKDIDLFLPVNFERPLRGRVKDYHAPYLLNLLRLRSFRLSIMSQAASIALRSGKCVVGGNDEYRDYVVNSGSVFRDVDSVWLSPTVASMFYPDATYRGDCYFVPLGNVQNLARVTEWDGISPLVCRTLYTVSSDSLYKVPPTCYIETVFGQVFFAIRDDVRSVTQSGRMGANFASSVIKTVPSLKPPDEQEEVVFQDHTPVLSGVAPSGDLTKAHLDAVLSERPLGSNQLFEAIRARWPSIMFTRRQLITMLHSDPRYKMGPNYWSVSL